MKSATRFAIWSVSAMTYRRPAEEEQREVEELNEQQVSSGNPDFQRGESLAKVPEGASVTSLKPLD